MPRLIKQAYGAMTGGTSWAYTTLGSTTDGTYYDIPPKTRLTTMRVHITGGLSDSTTFEMGLSEDTAGEHPITGLEKHTKTLSLINLTAKGCVSINLDQDYIVTSDATSAGKLYFWWKNNGSDTPTIKIYLTFSET